MHLANISLEFGVFPKLLQTACGTSAVGFFVDTNFSGGAS